AGQAPGARRVGSPHPPGDQLAADPLTGCPHTAAVLPACCRVALAGEPRRRRMMRRRATLLRGVVELACAPLRQPGPSTPARAPASSPPRSAARCCWPARSSSPGGNGVRLTHAGSTRQLTRTATAAGWPPRCAPFPSPDLSHPRLPARTFRLLSRVPL